MRSVRTPAFGSGRATVRHGLRPTDRPRRAGGSSLREPPPATSGAVRSTGFARGWSVGRGPRCNRHSNRTLLRRGRETPSVSCRPPRPWATSTLESRNATTGGDRVGRGPRWGFGHRRPRPVQDRVGQSRHFFEDGPDLERLVPYRRTSGGRHAGGLDPLCDGSNRVVQTLQGVALSRRSNRCDRCQGPANIGHGAVEVVDSGQQTLRLARTAHAGGAGQHQAEREDFPEQLIEQQLGRSDVRLRAGVTKGKRCIHLETPSVARQYRRAAGVWATHHLADSGPGRLSRYAPRFSTSLLTFLDPKKEQPEPRREQPGDICPGIELLLRSTFGDGGPGDPRQPHC